MHWKGISRSVDVISVKSYSIIVKAVIVDYENTHSGIHKQRRLPVQWKTHLMFVPPLVCSLSAFGVLLFLCVDTLPVCRPCRVFPSNGEKWKSERVSQHFSLIFYITRGEIDIITTMSAITPSRLVEKSFGGEREKKEVSHLLWCTF